MHQEIIINLIKGLCLFVIQYYTYLPIRRYLKDKITNPEEKENFCKKFIRLPHFGFIDQCPYFSWALIPYISLIPHIVSVFFFIPQQLHVLFFIAFMIMNMLQNIIFLLWPTSAPNDWIYHAENEKALLGCSDPLIENFLRRNDDPFFQRYLKKHLCPLEAAPSTHTTLSVMPLLFCFFYSVHVPWWYFSWSLSVALSTIPMKQHYFVDFLSGVVVAFLIPFGVWIVT